jgi:hypothetical protein
MADPILTGGIRVLSVLQGISGLPEDRYVNTWAFSSDVASTQAAQEAAAAKVETFFGVAAGVNPAVKSSLAAQSIDESACEFRVYWMGEAPPRTPLIIPWTIGTLGTAQALPSEVAVCCSFYAESNRPRNRGRVFIGPLTTGTLGGTAAQAPIVIGAFQGALRDAASDMMLDEIGPRWCVLGVNAAGTDRELKVVTAGWVDNAFDTQRRRGEDATSRTIFPV